MISDTTDVDTSRHGYQRAALLQLKDWIALSKFWELEATEDVNKEGVKSSSAAPKADASEGNETDAAAIATNFRRLRATLSIRVAKFIIHRLTSDAVGQSNVDESSITPEVLKIDEVSSENFLVEIPLPSELPIAADATSLSSNDILQKCDWDQIKFILEDVSDVKLVPALRDAVGCSLDERLESEFFERLGVLFYELFTCDGSPPPNIQQCDNDNPYNEDASHQRVSDRVRAEGLSLDEEQPGSNKGRRKYAQFDTSKAMKRLDLSGTMELLRQKSLPTAICRLVADLLECGVHNEGMFLSLGDVLSELMQIMNEPEIFVHEGNIGHMTLDFNEKILYGREDALSTLIHVVLTTPLLSESNTSPVVLIRGDPGAGKSKLVDTIKAPIRKRGWHFLSCKFDRLTQNQPLSTISSTFNDFFKSLAEMQSELEDGVRVDDDRHQFIGSVTASVESHLSASGVVFLSKLIPTIKPMFPDIFRRVVMDEDDSDEDDNDKNEANKTTEPNCDDSDGNEGDDDGCQISPSVKNRLHFLFQKLTQAISSPEAPILLFLDDLQWADRESLELLTSLVIDVGPLSVDEDDDQRCVCFVLAHRNDEDSENQDIMKCISAFEGSDAARVTHIQLEGMDIECTNAMIANALKLPIRLTRPLSKAVHQKTLGNPLFVKEFLTMLCEDRSLTYSLNEKRWLWTIDDIYRKSMNKDLALVLSEKLLRMPRDVREALTLVSCFGKKVKRDVISMASCDAEEFSRLLACLETAVDENILNEDGEYFTFPHDSIQQAAYEIAPEKVVFSYHFNIGLQILKNSVVQGQSDPISLMSFVALDQILAAKSVTISDPALSMSLAALFLRAGRYSLDVAAFPSALSYFERGLSFMGDDGWESNFELSLRLNESACHACYLNALPDRVPAYVDKVISHTKNFMDQVKCHHTAMQTLATTGNATEAVSKFFGAMKELGEEFPDKVDPSHIFSILVSTKN